MVFIILFLSAFISATLFPLGSEAIFLYDLKQGYNLYFLLFFATLGNSLGSLFNYFLGLKGEEYLAKRKFLKEKSIQKYKNYFTKYGFICLLFSWLPLVGDGFTFIAGILKYKLKFFIIFVVIAKFSRYLFLVLFV